MITTILSFLILLCCSSTTTGVLAWIQQQQQRPTSLLTTRHGAGSFHNDNHAHVPGATAAAVAFSVQQQQQHRFQSLSSSSSLRRTRPRGSFKKKNGMMILFMVSEKQRGGSDSSSSATTTSASSSSSSSSVNGSSSSSSSSTPASTPTGSDSSSTKTKRRSEGMIRREIEERNTVVNDEERYAVADGEFLERFTSTSSGGEPQQQKDGSTTSTTTTSRPLVDAAAATATEEAQQQKQGSSVRSQQQDDLSSTIERMTKPRAYPLFLLEKAAEFIETTADMVTDTIIDPSATSSTPSSSNNDDVGVPVRERLVVLGTGWAAVSFLKDIDTNIYDVTVISPRNHFVFTPMLAGASVGTVEFRSICEPIREIIGTKMTYLEATATNINPKTKKVTCESVICDGGSNNSCSIDDFEIEYDRLIYTIGSQTNTFGIPGVREYCCFLRQIDDARRIRTSIINCFERANLPSLSKNNDDEKIRNLTFAIIGAGPTGIEFAAELRDFIEQDGPKYYPKILQFVRIKVIEASNTVLAPFDKSLQQEAITQLKRKTNIPLGGDNNNNNVVDPDFNVAELLLESSVKEINEEIIFLNDGKEIPYGLAVWAAGNGPIPLTLQLINALKDTEQSEQQSIARGRLGIDPWMRVIGSKGSILAFGDCSAITQYGQQLPATAQVASQQGEYLASLMNRKYNFSPSMISTTTTTTISSQMNDDTTTTTTSTTNGVTTNGISSNTMILPPPMKDPTRTETSFSDMIASFAINNNEYAKPFQFLNLGILAYTGGGSALAQVTPLGPNGTPVKGTGTIGNAIWRSVYLSKQISIRNRLLVINDWTKRQIFGRDVTRL